jgi:hypothetical protein
MNIIWTIIISIISSSTFIAILFFIGKNVLVKGTDFIFSKRLENYKSKLKSIELFEEFERNKKYFEFNQFALSKHRIYPMLYKKIMVSTGMLERLTKIHSIPTFENYTKEDIKAFLEKKNMLKGVIDNYVNTWGIDKENQIKRLQTLIYENECIESNRIMNIAINYFVLHELYFSNEVVEIGERLFGVMENIQRYYDVIFIDKMSGTDFVEKYSSNIELMRELIVKVKEQMKAEIKIGYSE